MTYNEVRYFRLMFEQNQLNTIPRQRIGASYLIVLPNMTKYVLSIKINPCFVLFQRKKNGDVAEEPQTL